MGTAVALSPQARAEALDRMAEPSSTCSSSAAGWWAPAPRWTPPPAACGRPGRGPRLGQRHLQPVQQAASTAACATSRCSTSGWCTRRCGSAGCSRRARAAPGPAGAVPLPAAAPGLGAAVRRARDRCSTTRWRGLAGRRAPAAAPQAPHPARRAADRARRCARTRWSAPIQYYDAQVDDARHTMNIARTAAHYGALVATRSQVIGFLREGERVTGALVARPGDRPRRIEVRARQVINATGVWTDDTQALVGDRGQFHVRASKGVHLVVPRDRIHSRHRRSSCAPRRACCSSSRGAGTGSSAPPTPTGSWTRPTRRRPRPTSTTSSSTSTRCSPRR